MPDIPCHLLSLLTSLALGVHGDIEHWPAVGLGPFHHPHKWQNAVLHGHHYDPGWPGTPAWALSHR
eukprot:1142044-Karenia_brevis.AAC.1